MCSALDYAGSLVLRYLVHLREERIVPFDVPVLDLSQDLKILQEMAKLLIAGQRRPFYLGPR
jgi:hypothetical protein